MTIPFIAIFMAYNVLVQQRLTAARFCGSKKVAQSNVGCNALLCATDVTG